MYSDLFQQLTIHELDRYVAELEEAVENHAQWMAHINHTLICGLTPSESDLADNPDHLCKFGHWFHGLNNPVLTSLESYRAIDIVHKEMHLTAKSILLRAQSGEKCKEGIYNKLLELAETLRERIRTLLKELNHNRKLILRLMSTVFENANEGVVISSPDSKIVSVNKAFTKVTGYTAEEVIGKTPAILRSSKQGRDFYVDMWKELESYGEWQGEIWNRNKQGEDYLEWLSITAVKDEQGGLSHYVGIFSDITSAKDNEARLEQLAHYDQLTGLPNRILFNDRLKQAMLQSKRAGKQAAVMFLDLDGFKEVNDTLGHSSGDELLCQVAQRLSSCLRASDTVARFGGDEFTIVLASIDDIDDVIRIAHKIINEVAIPYDIDGSEAAITTSIGISLYPEDGDDPNVLIQRADNAMYHAKRHGKNHHEFYGDR